MNKKNNALTLTRRSFVQGLSASIAGLTFTPFNYAASTTLDVTLPQTTVVIYQDKAHFDYSGVLDAYVAPRSVTSSTQRYVDSIDTQTFLSRHWFS